ncbi:MAG TPA: trypsin-like peptidase domain-containing protein, partial [Nitrospirota bacterium]|nr:trypsin-like peptidase domain-containing protein [Nitrospirota bacterium]
MKERVLLAAFACAVLLLTVFSFQRGRTKDGYTAEDVAPPDFSAVVEKVMPSLVKVENEGLAGHPDITGKGSTVEIAQTREGTGFFIDKDGLILTNYHVIQGANALRVITSERRRYDAQIIGADVLSDVALIRIKPDFKVTPVALGDSARLKVGQWVLAMGNPLGLEFFSSAGIVSGFGPPGS